MNRLTFSIIIFAAVSAAGIFFIWPRYQDLSQLEGEVLQKETNLRYHEGYAKGLLDLKQKAEEKKSEIQIVENSLPDTQELPSLYERIGVLTSESGLVTKNISLIPAQSGVSAKVQSIGIALELQGSYEALKQLIEATRKNPRILTIQSFRLVSAQRPGDFQFSVQLEAYSY
ncbi:MAG: type 4a pilus biogenesis protein PilO [bacterium]|nr:type 4a pilus biogenesis protein PilO [bacterium]